MTTPLDYRAALESAALADVGGWGKILFRGPDRSEVLQGLLTNDVKSIAPGLGTPVCLLTSHGKLVADAFLVNQGDAFLSFHRPAAALLLQENLAKYLALGDTVAEDVSSSLYAFFLAGPRGRARSAGMESGAVSVEVPPVLFGVPGFLAIGPSAGGPAVRDELLLAAGGAVLSPETMEVLRVEAGIPALGVDTDAEVYPAEVNLGHALSDSKGCYLGQETTARLRTQGRPKRGLAALRLQARPLPGDPVLQDGAPAGKVTSVVDSPKLGAPLAMALIRSDCLAVGTRLSVASPGGILSAEVASFPGASAGKNL